MGRVKLRVFVSHSHQDDTFTQRLVDDLREAGADVWVDMAAISHGNFMQRIDEALEQCEWMVLVLTPSAISSPYVKQEVYTALHRVQQGYMRDVIPVVAAPCAPGTIPPQWDVLHRYDATRDYEAARARVLHALGLSQAAIAPPDSAPMPSRLPEQSQLLDLPLASEGKLDVAALLARVDAVRITPPAMAQPTEEVKELLTRGDALRARERYTWALTAYNRALALAPDYATAWYNKGVALQCLHRDEEALVALDQALVLDTDFVAAWYSKGLALLSLKLYERALAALDRATSLDPQNAPAWYTMGWVLRQLGRRKKAEEAERRAKHLGWQRYGDGH